MGGFIARYFSSQFPDEVKGLILLDPTPEVYYESMLKKDQKKFIEMGNKLNRTKHAPKCWKKWYQFVPNLVYMKNLNISKNLPFILVSASESNLYKYQEKIMAGFKNTRHIELAGGYYLRIKYPDLIIKYIKELSSLTNN